MKVPVTGKHCGPETKFESSKESLISKNRFIPSILAIIVINYCANFKTIDISVCYENATNNSELFGQVFDKRAPGSPVMWPFFPPRSLVRVTLELRIGRYVLNFYNFFCISAVVILRLPV